MTQGALQRQKPFNTSLCAPLGVLVLAKRFPGGELQVDVHHELALLDSEQGRPGLKVTVCGAICDLVYGKSMSDLLVSDECCQREVTGH